MIVAVVGATGTGKSALSLDIAERLPGAEIVNADAMQLYRGMDIGTAKLPVAERRGVPHHLLDVLSPADEASVADYQQDARAAISDIEARGRVAVLVGGSGLYVSSVINDFQFPGTDAALRETLEAELLELGPGILFSRLRELDAEAAASIGPHNGRRIVRALEVIELTGKPFGAGLPDEAGHWRPTVVLGLRLEREVLKPRLDARVEAMWRDGLLDEVAGLGPLGTTASRAIGYAQALAQLGGQLSESEAIEQAQALTRKYARRQVSWFRRYPSVTWLEADDPERLTTAMAAIATSATETPSA
jgi:tRNA dimethylallyltransferase